MGLKGCLNKHAENDGEPVDERSETNCPRAELERSLGGASELNRFRLTVTILIILYHFTGSIAALLLVAAPRRAVASRRVAQSTRTKQREAWAGRRAAPHRIVPSRVRHNRRY